MRRDAIERRKVGDYIVSVYQDEDPMDPREWDNLSTMLCFHKRYSLGDKHDYRSEDYDGWDDVRAMIEREYDPVTIVPLYLFDHSGLTIRADASGFRMADSAGWDWGIVGFAFVTPESLENMGTAAEDAEKVMLAEIEEYDSYLRGDVYGYVVSKIVRCDHGDEHEDVLESCWGYIGDPDYALEEGIAVARSYSPEDVPVEDVTP